MSEWISMKDKLPPEPDYYLATDGKNVREAFWRGVEWKGILFRDSVTHWAEMLEPPLKTITHDCPNDTDNYFILRDKKNNVDSFNIFDGDSPYLCGIYFCPWCGEKA